MWMKSIDIQTEKKIFSGEKREQIAEKKRERERESERVGVEWVRERKRETGRKKES